jgi:hypothetical protein
MVDRLIIDEWLAKAENDFEMDWPVETTKDKAQRAQDAAARIRELVRFSLSA